VGRPTSVQRDHVIFLDGGRVVDGGTHDALLRHDGRYAAF
jgi:ATP-binding cassette subfamily B protein IrtB